jgi:hypothetical protein
MVVVPDVAAVCAQAGRLGGKVLMAPATSKDGLVFAGLARPGGQPLRRLHPAARVGARAAPSREPSIMLTRASSDRAPRDLKMYANRR